MSTNSPEKNTLCSSVRQYIVSKILDGTLKEGDKVNESKLCSELNLSRSPVREGIRELIADDILVNENFKGTRIGQFNDKELSELNSLRILLEQLAVDYSVPRMTEKTRSEFMKIVNKMKIAEEKNDNDLLVELDMDFHYHLILQSNSNVIISTWKRIYTKLHILMAMRLKWRTPQRQYDNHLYLVSYYSSENIHLFKEMLMAHEHMRYYSDTAHTNQ
ncbi:GntR family transcriptional regulator [uncultured Sphaerochaeta sp.]|uniref:GntR family transcriptional regulator n=1 Tax=uncultured Sphaerochaeta sp. TaxID=886478 RepID=UPI002A0A4557|nr:GntR family transcriptional regulator [uncultured Sphaerochaeta sp.]